ncbi:DUF1192 domain-containing protein [Sneathiella chinensis]|uniref:DUF1192 domain-containing protein n=1 Tax=Sneathiella chinensis TaxID=349750 RepID=A0ABQ5U2Y1_9PROT|nr:DUF1192 domain-containing protein [Sneathiella chinensis]GLQ06269.1 hypothetical protein GCM10007924_14900 [Sneathiella chinensis]
MARDEDDQPILTDRTADFSGMSINELEDYISLLKAEIGKVETILQQKRQAEVAANSIFKS